MMHWYYAFVWRWLPGWQLERTWGPFTESTWPVGEVAEPMFERYGPPYKLFQLYMYTDKWTVIEQEQNW